MNTALLAGACALSGVFVVLLIFSVLYSRYLSGGLLLSSSSGVVDLTNEHGEIDPEKQIRHLKKSTAEFGIRYDELKFGKMLGKGSQGEVFKATWRGSNVAVKKVDTRKVPPEIIEEFCQEAQIMRRLRHPCLTLFMGVSLEHPHLCIVTEVVSRGSLFDIIHDEAAPLTWQRCLGIALDMARGMTYLHAHNPPILHRDLKSLNVLVDGNWRGKVADFGMTRFQEDGTMTQCVSVETEVHLRDGGVVRAGDVCAGMELVGQDGAFVTVQRAKCDTTDLMYRVSHEDGSAYTVTPNHLVTLRWAAGPVCTITAADSAATAATRERDSKMQRMIDMQWWEFVDGRPVQRHWGARHCRLAQEQEQDGPIPLAADALVGDSDYALRDLMWAEFRASAAAGARGALALHEGDLIDIRADVLCEEAVWSIISGENRQPRATGRRTTLCVALEAGAKDVDFHSRGLRLREVLPIAERGQQYCAISVDGNQRFAIEGGILTHNCGSPLWMAPEMIRNDPYDEKSDVYSFAICLWEMYTRKIPYRELGLNPSHLVVKVVKEALRPPIPKQCPKAFRALMEKCWNPLAEKRPTFPAILKTLEAFMQDPVMLNHKPMSSRDATVIVRPERVDPEPTGAGDHPASSSLGAALGLTSAERGWKIDPAELHYWNDNGAAFVEVAAADLATTSSGGPMSPSAVAGGGGLASPSGGGAAPRNLRSPSKGGSLGDGKLKLMTDTAASSEAADVDTSTSQQGKDKEKKAKSEKKSSGSSTKKNAVAVTRVPSTGGAAGAGSGGVTATSTPSQTSTTLDRAGSVSNTSGAVVAAPLVLNSAIKSTKEAKDDERERLSSEGGGSSKRSSGGGGGGGGARRASQGPGMLLAKFRNKLVSVKACFLDSKHLHLSNEERVLADLDGGKGARESKLASFMARVAGMRHPNLVLFQGAFLEPIDALRSKLKESGQIAGSGLDESIQATPAAAAAAAAPASSSAAAASSSSTAGVSTSALSVPRPPPGCEYYLGCVSEFMPRGTLHDILCDTSLVVDWSTMIQLLLDVAAGMAYLHGFTPAVVHHDFSSHRLLVDKNWRVRVGEYAFVDLNATLSGQVPPAGPWSAPEYIKNPNHTTLSMAANVYSFGNLMWQAVVRRPLWDSQPLSKRLADKIVKQGDRPQLPSSFASRELKNLIEKCWMAASHARPTFAQILDELQRLKQMGPPKITLKLGVNAHKYRKAKTVFAYRSKDPVTILKDWGTNLGKRNCIIIFSGEDDVYLCDEEVFKATYERLDSGEAGAGDELEGGGGGGGLDGDKPAVQLTAPSSALADPMHGHHEWRKTGTVLARCMEQAFSIKTAGGTEHGMAGDYLVQNDQGSEEQWSVEAQTFLEMYERWD